AFARVLMVDPKILILDEATSSVDPYTETLIQDALDKAKKGRTTIIIAHRLSTIKNADEIYVLENGEFVEHGSHDALMAQKGQYANLVAMQAQDVETA
ncbi:MAG: ABC transporter ATP-binding protein, partial [Candidatus Heimdallarchaeota archaeon]|nr:ABC transporter ATP-binding protein [Candidatus Heimdallarchaeota archaeon]